METLTIQGIPAILYGAPSEKLFLFIHGRNGCKEEAAAFAEIACPKGCQVLGFDLPEHGERKSETDTFFPWNAVSEFKNILSFAKGRWSQISVRANSIGAYFSMLSFAEESIHKCLFVSPIFNMEKLIGNMMIWSGVTEERLEKEGVIPTDFGETLSWEYLNYVRNHRIADWQIPTSILYGTADNLQERQTVDAFIAQFSCKLTVMKGGEHWFHTPEQLEVLARWETNSMLD